MNNVLIRSLVLIGWACWLSASPLTAQETAPAGVFSFVQITDTHIGVSDNLQRTEKVVAAINALPQEVEFVAHTGDLFYNTIKDEALLRSALAVLKTLKAPLYVAPGNHDILAADLPATLKLFTNHVGPLHFVTEHQGVRIVFFYSEPCMNAQPLTAISP